MSLTTDEKQSLSDQLRGTGGWKVPTDKRAAEIRTILNADEYQYQDAVAIVRHDNRVSTSYVQRQLRIGYNESSRIIERMEKEGIISAVSNIGKREVL